MAKHAMGHAWPSKSLTPQNHSNVHRGSGEHAQHDPLLTTFFQF